MTLTTKKKEAAIRKWIGISHGRVRDYHARNCTLCIEFQHDERDDDDENELGGCDNKRGETCPIALNGHEYCETTPYTKWRRHQNQAHIRHGRIEWNKTATCTECQVLALVEMLFVYDAIDKHLGWD
jgi:hypothetical protein